MCARALLVMVAGQGKGEPGRPPAPKEVPQWRRDSEFSGKVRVLEWGGLSRTTAQWPTRWVALYRGSLYVMPREDADTSPTTYNIWTNRCKADMYLHFAAVLVNAGLSAVLTAVSYLHDTMLHKTKQLLCYAGGW